MSLNNSKTTSHSSKMTSRTVSKESFDMMKSICKNKFSELDTASRMPSYLKEFKTISNILVKTCGKIYDTRECFGQE